MLIRYGVLCHGEPFHHLDHLSYVADWMGIPLILSHQSMLEYVQKFYPFVTTRLYLDWSVFKEEQLAKEYDVLFYSKFFELAPKINKYRQKDEPPFRTVYCPHGNSDKGLSSCWMEAFGDEDICFVYGNKMKEFLNLKGVVDKGNWITTGNYRYHYYLKYQDHFDSLAQSEVFSHFKYKAPLVLYAPTWNDLEKNSSFPEVCEFLVQDKFPGWNLLIKLHPELSTDSLAWVTHWKERSKLMDHVHVVEDFIPVYPLLSQTALYIGDMSSVGYDYLAFQGPLILLNSRLEADEGLCDVSRVVRREDYSKLSFYIEEELKSEGDKKKVIELYDHVFCKKRKLEAIKAEVFSMLNG